MKIVVAEKISPSAMALLQGHHVQVIVGTHGSTMSAVAAEEAQRRHLLVWETGAVGNLDMSDSLSATTSRGAGWTLRVPST